MNLMKQQILNRILVPLCCTAALLSSSARAQGLDETIRITPLVHASVLLEYDGTTIYIDPWSVVDLEALPGADLILITDDSGHHMDAVAIQQLSRPHTTIVSPQSGEASLPHTIVLDNGETQRLGSITIESIAAYDIIPGAPEHPRGEANGYVVDLGSHRVYFAGVTECVPEVQALQGIDVAFIPMNIPVGRMTPQATADCIRQINPEVAYIYHYDQTWALRAAGSSFPGWELPDGLTVAQSLRQLERLMEGSEITIRADGFYPSSDEEIN